MHHSFGFPDMVQEVWSSDPLTPTPVHSYVALCYVYNPLGALSHELYINSNVHIIFTTITGFVLWSPFFLICTIIAY